MILLRNSGTPRYTSSFRISHLLIPTYINMNLIWDMVTSHLPSHQYSLGPCKSIYVPDSYWILPPLWDGLVSRVGSLAEPAWEVTTWLTGQEVNLDIKEREKPGAPNITTSESAIDPIVVFSSTPLSTNPLSSFLHPPFRLLKCQMHPPCELHGNWLHYASSVRWIPVYSY